jgi:nucleoside-diphosphate-sugar epimerase
MGLPSIITICKKGFLMAETSKILVTGGTGKVGRRLVQRLIESSFSVRIASRREPHTVSGGKVEHRYFDWADETTYGPVLEGIQRLFMEYEGIRNGLEDRVMPTVERVTGRPPRSLADFAAAYTTQNVPAY